MYAKRLTSIAVLAAAAAFGAPALAAPFAVVTVAPPAPRYEVVPGPRAGYLWTPGYWDWRRGRHVWVGGNWVRERRGYVYAHPAWVEDGGRWRFNRGGWNRGGGDRDHDGVPNRYDRRPDNPHRR